MAIKPTRGMVLAAGLGTRMRPLTNDRPKSLIVVAGRTLLDHAIDRFKDAGITTIIVNVHYKGQMVIDHLKKRTDVEIIIQDERDKLLDTGGALKKALPLFKGEPVFTYNSDSIWLESLGSNLTRMAQRWDDAEMDCLMLMAPTFNSIGYEGRGDFTMDTLGRLTRRQPQRVTPFAWPGVQIIHPRLIERGTGDVFSTNRLWDLAIEQGRLFGIRLDGKWMHIGTPDAKDEADAFLDVYHVEP
ncbi:MAG: nucleotidyltransferase family protein [Alphaproteobacteria bacterium]|jgi:MurNAc alpha-1-phosphate uridylyltransferase|nr:nucleotidyltransferase family protein [Alphaproteobacteria bacterium]